MVVVSKGTASFEKIAKDPETAASGSRDPAIVGGVLAAQLDLVGVHWSATGSFAAGRFASASPLRGSAGERA